MPERCARAVWSDKDRAYTVRVVLEWLRDNISEEMVEAGGRVNAEVCVTYDNAASVAASVAFRAMIDAALNDASPTPPAPR